MAISKLAATHRAQGDSVGSFTFTFEVADTAQTRFVSVEALVDTGADL